MISDEEGDARHEREAAVDGVPAADDATVAAGRDLEGANAPADAAAAGEEQDDGPHARAPAALESIAIVVDSAEAHALEDAPTTPSVSPGGGDAAERSVKGQADTQQDVNQRVCFICMEATPPLLVGNVCACHSLSVHQTCLEEYLNHSMTKRTRSVQSRLTCAICNEPYRLPYETELEGARCKKEKKLPRWVVVGAALSWLGLGGWIAFMCYHLDGEKGGEGSPSLRYVALIVVLCVYLTCSSGMYIRSLQQHAASNGAAQDGSAQRTRIHFTGAAP